MFPDESLDIDDIKKLKNAPNDRVQLEILDRIIEHRSNKNPHFSDAKDRTLPHVLAAMGFLKGFERIANLTGNINPKNGKGETPLMFAEKNRTHIPHLPPG